MEHNMANQKTTSGKFWVAVLAIFGGLATIQIIFLIIQNRELKRSISVANAAQRVEALKPGDKLPAFNGINAVGIETKVSYDEADRLLFITSTKWPWCEKTLRLQCYILRATRYLVIKTARHMEAAQSPATWRLSSTVLLEVYVKTFLAVTQPKKTIVVDVRLLTRVCDLSLERACVS
jgi:hypothetical protein